MRLKRLLAYFSRISVEDDDRDRVEITVRDRDGTEYPITSVGFDSGTLTWSIRIDPPKGEPDAG